MRYDTKLGLALLFTVLLFGTIFLSGCQSLTPYVAYEHRDVSPLDGGDDAWDLGCAGVKYVSRLEVKAGYCYNARGGNMLEARVEYDLLRVGE